MNLAELVIAGSAAIVLYTWIGYPLLLFSVARRRATTAVSSAAQPSFSIIVAVHNEEARIAAKLQECLALDYPKERIEIIIASDGSTDQTEPIARQFAARDQRVKLVTTRAREGKSGAQNLAAECSRGDVLLFTDAETRSQPSLLQTLARHFGDPAIGLVSCVVHFGNLNDTISRGQRAYWRFEVMLRQLESDLGILATASGQAFAVRRELFCPLPPEFGDDCIVPLNVRLQGFRVMQDAAAVVWDRMPHSVRGELRTRVRMTARNWSGILSQPRLLNPFCFTATSWALVSHKFLRWLTPVFLLIAFLASSLLALQGGPLWLLATQLGFYAAAVMGWLLSRKQWSCRILGYPFAFCLANAGFLLGILKSLRGERIVAYK